MKQRFAIFMMSFLLANCGGQRDYIAEQLAPYGYLRIAPPRAELFPGTVVAIDTGDQQSRVEIICRPSEAFPGARPPQVSATETQNLAAITQKSYQLEANFLAAIKADGKYSAIDDISLVLSNPKVYEYATSDLYAVLGARTQPCTEAVAAAKSQKKAVFTVLQAYQADVTYHVLTKSSTSGSAAPAIALLGGTLGASLDASSSSSTDTTLVGNALFWGLYPERIEAADTRGPDSDPASVIVPTPALSPAERSRLVRVPATIASP